MSADRVDKYGHKLTTDRQCLIRLMAIVRVCRDLQTPKRRAEYLAGEFRQTPKLIWYFRQVYDHYVNFGIDSTRAFNLSNKEKRTAGVWAKYTELREILYDLRSGKLQGLPAKMAWRLFMETLPTELRPIACSVLDKDLCCGITTATLNKVLAHLGKNPVNVKPDHTPVASPGHMRLEITSAGGAIDPYSATAVLYYADERVANVVFAVCPKMRLALAVLRGAGITLDIPSYIRPQDIEGKNENRN